MLPNHSQGIKIYPPTVERLSPTLNVQTPGPSLSLSEDRKAGELPSPRPRRVAVLACHGMGDQVPYQTIDEVCTALIAHGAEEGRLRPFPDGRQFAVAFTVIAESGARTVEPNWIARAEIPLTGAKGKPYEVHVYEAYWAPLPEGRVTLRDVIRFLYEAAVDGIRFSRRESFARYLFGEMRPLKVLPLTAFHLIVAMFGVTLLLGTVLLFWAALLARLLVQLGTPWPDQHLSSAAGTVLVGAASACVVLGGLACLETRSGSTTIPPANGAVPVAPKGNAKSSPCFVGQVLAALVTVGMALGIGWAAALLMHRINVRLSLWIVILAGSLIAAFLSRSRRWLLQSIGHVAAYIAAHTVSKFYELRREIQAVGRQVAWAIYGLRDPAGGPLYDDVVIVGHSLGSILAYDTLNTMLNEELTLARSPGRPSPPAPGGIAQRTKLLLTFGSPLDKTAFIFRTQEQRVKASAREALAGAVQPITQDYWTRPARWVNVWSKADLISGDLSYYDDPGVAKAQNAVERQVRNIDERISAPPNTAHTGYWQRRLVGEILFHAVLDLDFEAWLVNKNPRP